MSSSPCPIYTTVDSVKVRLAGKVQFQEDPEDLANGELPNALLIQLIVDSETEIEQDLRSRYAIPFRSIRSGFFKDLPDHTKRAIRMAVDMKSVMNIIDTDFGRGTHINADGYKKNLVKHYEILIARLLGKDMQGEAQYVGTSKIERFKKSPPLEDLLLAPTNKADDGYSGMIINTDKSTHDAVTYAEEQLNNPAISYLNAIPQDLTGGPL